MMMMMNTETTKRKTKRGNKRMVENAPLAE
jgi:hypothetical protein